MRRRQLAVVGLVALVALSGCAGLTGPLSFSASQATVTDQALHQTNYQTASVDKSGINRTVSRYGITKRVVVTNWIAQYDRTIDLGPLGKRRGAVFSVISTPQVRVPLLGAQNPVAHYDNQRLVTLLQQNYQGVSDVRHVSDYQTTVLGHRTTVGKYSARATLQGGQTVDVYVQVTKVQDGGDYVVAAAVYPQQLDGQEAPRVKTLFGGIRHGNASG